MIDRCTLTKWLSTGCSCFPLSLLFVCVVECTSRKHSDQWPVQGPIIDANIQVHIKNGNLVLFTAKRLQIQTKPGTGGATHNAYRHIVCYHLLSSSHYHITAFVRTVPLTCSTWLVAQGWPFVPLILSQQESLQVSLYPHIIPPNTQTRKRQRCFCFDEELGG